MNNLTEQSRRLKPLNEYESGNFRNLNNTFLFSAYAQDIDVESLRKTEAMHNRHG